MSDTLTLPPDRRPLPWPQSTLPGYVGAPPPPPTPPPAPPPTPVAQPPTISGQNQPWTAAPPGQPPPSYGTTPPQTPPTPGGGIQTPYGFDPKPAPAWPAPFLGTTSTQPTPGDYAPSRDGTIPATPNNNPGNIRSGPGGSFGTYPTPQAGRDAIGNLLIAYNDQHGLNTVAGMINRYCPPFDPKAGKANDTAGYIRTVAAKLGVDPNQPIDIHDPATRDAMVNAIIGVEQGGRVSPPQRYVTSDQIPHLANREPGMWGRPPQGGYSVGGVGGDLPRTIPDFINIMTRLAQMGSMLSGRSAFGQAYANQQFNGLVQGMQQGQEFQTKLHAEQYQQAMTEFRDRIAEENMEIGSIVAAESANPEQMNRDLAEVANRNNDRVLMAAIQNGPDAIQKLMQARDHLGSDASRASAAWEKEQDARQQQQMVKDTVAADMRQWDQENSGATPDQRQVALFEATQRRQHEMSAKGAGTGTSADAPTGQLYDVVGQDGKPTGQQVRMGKNTSELMDPSSGSKVTLQPGQRLEQTPRARTEGAGDNFEVSKLYDVIDKNGNVTQSGVELRERKDKAGFVHAETGEPLQLGPGERVRQTTPTTTTGGRAGAQTGRQFVAAEEVRADLENIVKLPIGTTVGASGVLHPGDKTIGEAVLGTMARSMTDQDSALMQASIAGLQRELSTLMSPVYGGKYASDQIDALTPKPGDSTYTVLFKIARMRQAADNAIKAMINFPWISQDQKAEAREAAKAFEDAVPWSPGQVTDFLHQGDPSLSFSQFVEHGGITPRGREPGGGALPQAQPDWATQSATGPNGEKIYSPDGQTWFHPDHTPVQ